MLGGVEIRHEKGLQGHSDADVVLHAVCDALLGAVNKGDIGYHFPPDAPAFKGIASTKLLQQVYDIVTKEGYELNNLDVTICLQKPKLSSYIPEMQSGIASIMAVNPGQISLKATTTERLGFEGREEGISAHAVVMIKRKV